MVSKRHALLPVLLLSLILGGCSSSKNFHLSEEYKSSKQDTPVMIVPLMREAFPNGTSHTFGYLNTEQELVFTRSADQAFSRSAGVPSRVAPLDSTVTQSLQKRTLELDGSSFETFVPAGSAQIATSDFNPGFVLLLDQFRYSKQTATVGGSGYAGHEQEAVYNLIFQTNYVYWNPKTGETAAWGSARASVSLDGSEATTDEYATVLSRVFEDIVRQGPVRGANP